MQVAQVFKCRMYDCICKFDRAKGREHIAWSDVQGDADWINKASQHSQRMFKGKASPWTQVTGRANWIPGNGSINLCVGDDD